MGETSSNMAVCQKLVANRVFGTATFSCMQSGGTGQWNAATYKMGEMVLKPHVVVHASRTMPRAHDQNYPPSTSAIASIAFRGRGRSSRRRIKGNLRNDALPGSLCLKRLKSLQAERGHAAVLDSRPATAVGATSSQQRAVAQQPARAGRAWRGCRRAGGCNLTLMRLW